MAIDKFIELFAEQFDHADIESFDENTLFKQSEDWSSLTSLFLISMADEEFNVSLKGEDIQKANTIGDLYHIIQSRI